MKKIISIFLLILLFTNFASALNIVSVNSNGFEPGENGLISLEIENEHDFDITDINIILDLSREELPIAPVDSSASVFVDEIESGDDDLIQFNVIVLPEANLGIYKIPVLINYVGLNDTVYEREEMISLSVESEPKISLSVDEPDFIVGNFADISIGIVNEGFSDIKFLKVKIGESDFFDILSSNEVYVGELDSDDFDRTEFKLMLKDPMSSINIPISLEYYDETNQFYTFGDTLRLNVYSEDEAKKLGLIENQKNYWWVFVVALVLFFVIRKIKKKR